MELNPGTIAHRSFRVLNAGGIHARPAAKIVQFTCRHPGTVHVSMEEERGDGKSMMHLMLLAAGPGTVVTFEFGPPAESADRILAGLADLFADRFGEA